MKFASWSLFVLVLASLTSWESHAQRENRPERPDREDRRPQPQPQPIPQPIPSPLPHYEDRHGQDQILSERIQQTIGRGQRLRLAELLRSFGQRAEVLSLSITAQSFNGPAQLQLLSRGGIIEQLQVRRQLNEVRALSQLGSLEDLELTSIEDIYIESITAQIRAARPQGPQYPQPMPEMQVAPHTLITVRVDQDVVNGEIALKRLVKEQLGLSLEGAQIERVAVEGMQIGRSAPALHVEINNKIASNIAYLNSARRRTPLRVHSLEEVRSLRLVVSGPARISDINIRIGAVRPVYQPIPVPVPLPVGIRLQVNQEITASYPLDLSLFTREPAFVSALSLETNLRSRIAANLSVINRHGQIVGRAQISASVTHIVLTQPSKLSDLRIFTEFPVHISGIQAELDRRY